MSGEADKFGTRQEPAMSLCLTCGDETPLADLSPENECGLCVAIRRLRVTMEKSGRMHPQLFGNQALPPDDR